MGEIEQGPFGMVTVGPGSGGLTKRELFAAMAMHGLMGIAMDRNDKSDRRWSEQRAALAVKHADALLAALAEEPKP
jgi:hypothetical protein